MNDLSHLKKIGEDKYSHRNWCGKIKFLLKEPFTHVPHVLRVTLELEKICETCQYRFLHKMTEYGCDGYMEYEKREGNNVIRSP